MKKNYTKPQISVETFTMDQPIAAGCSADPELINSMMGIGYFTEKRGCALNYFDASWGNDTDTVCYHSNQIIAFMS